MARKEDWALVSGSKLFIRFDHACMAIIETVLKQPPPRDLSDDDIARMRAMIVHYENTTDTEKESLDRLASETFQDWVTGGTLTLALGALGGMKPSDPRLPH